MQTVICWCDIPVLDLKRAIAFYTAVLGEAVTLQSGEGFEFGLLPHVQDQESVSGCLYVSEGNKPSQHGPLVYLNVAGRLDQAIAAVSANGGTVVQPKQAIGPHGFRAVVEDSEGNRIALHSPTA